MAASQSVAPLALSTVRRRFPRLFREYALLARREESEDAAAPDGSSARAAAAAVVDAATGLRTVIRRTDFAAPLDDLDDGGDGGDFPMAAGSDAGRFAAFLFRTLEASESGSAEDDARRQFGILKSALDDVATMEEEEEDSADAAFQHLLGWTVAAAHHGLDALLAWRDGGRTRMLFEAAGDEWNAVLGKTALGKRAVAGAPSKHKDDDRSGTGGVSEELRGFAIDMWNTLQMLVKQQVEDYGEPRIEKGGVSPTAPTEAEGTPPARSSALIAGGLSRVRPNTITAVATKPSRTARLGIGIAQERGKRGITITSIPAHSLFAGTGLRVGMRLVTVNGRGYASFAEGLALLREAEGRVAIVAAPGVAPAIALPAAARGGSVGVHSSTSSASATTEEGKNVRTTPPLPQR